MEETNGVQRGKKRSEADKYIVCNRQGTEITRIPDQQYFSGNRL